MSSTDEGPLPSQVGEAPAVPDSALAACPGRGLPYPELCEFVFGKHPDNWLLGCCKEVFIGYSTRSQIRRNGASGGVITQVLLYLLEEGLIDGAVVVEQGRPKPWLAEPTIAIDVQSVRRASQSVYVPVPVNAILDRIERFPGRLAFVGLPDQVASLRMLQKLGHHGACKIDYVLGPYVGTAIYFRAVESFLRSHGVRDLRDVVSLKYRAGEWPGYLRIETSDGRILRAKKFYYNYLIPFYITRGSLLSVDFANELTDISVGDAWHPRYEEQGKGYSVVAARTERGYSLLKKMKSRGELVLDPVDAAEALKMHGHMFDFKKRGAFLRIWWLRKLGHPVPSYGYEPAKIPLGRKIVEVGVGLIFFVCRSSIARILAEKVPVALLGPVFDLLRRLWKGISKPNKRRGLGVTRFVITGSPSAR